MGLVPQNTQERGVGRTSPLPPWWVHLSLITQGPVDHVLYRFHCQESARKVYPRITRMSSQGICHHMHLAVTSHNMHLGVTSHDMHLGVTSHCMVKPVGKKSDSALPPPP
jgi:hypothetical protein